MQLSDNLDEICFGHFRFDLRQRRLLRDDEPVELGGRAIDILRLLALAEGAVVSKDELMARLWPGRTVAENNLHVHVSALRKALDRRDGVNTYIVTVPGRGYRLAHLGDSLPASSNGFAAAEHVPLPDQNSISVLALANSSPATEQELTDKIGNAEMRPRPSAGRPTIWIAVALALLVGATAAWQVRSRWISGTSFVPRLSIVVLPFGDLSGDPGQQYLADGITQDLTTDLSRLSDDLLVISHQTAFTYKDKPVSAKGIGRELGVRYMLEGSVQRSDDQVRVNALLTDTDSDTHLWAERFDSSIGDLLTLQNEITARIAITLDQKLIASEAIRPKEHPDALDHIFRGRAEVFKPASRQNFAAAIAEFEQALALDPRSVEAQARLATALSSRLLDNMSDTIDADIDRANRLVEQALATAPESPLAHFAKGQLLRAQHRCGAAVPEYETVLAANRNVVAAIGNIGQCKIYLGLLDDGVAFEERAIRLSPRDPFLGVWYFRIGQARLLQSRVDEAISWLEKANEKNSAYPFVHAWLAAAYGLKGDLPRAAAELAATRGLRGNGWPATIVAVRTSSAKDFTAPASQTLLETTYLAGLHQAGLPKE